jgi:hypothetical protein
VRFYSSTFFCARKNATHFSLSGAKKRHIQPGTLNGIQLTAKKRVEEKILKGYYQFHEILCPICNMNDYEIIAQKDRYGLLNNTVICKTFGIDLGADYLEYGIKNHNLNLKNISLADYINGGGIDIVIYSHVLEHTRLPNELFLIKSICHKNTLIYIEVPGLLSVHINYIDFLLYLQNAHLYYFSLNVLTNLFQRFGFSLVFGDEYIHSLFIYGDHCSVIHSNCYEENIRYLRKIEINIKRYRHKILNICILFLKMVHLYKTAKTIYKILKK